VVGEGKWWRGDINIPLSQLVFHGFEKGMCYRHSLKWLECLAFFVIIVSHLERMRKFYF
jgi:hypothetical protein